MNNSKDTWVAVIVAIVVAGFFFGVLFFYGNPESNNQLNNTMMGENTSTTTASLGIPQTRPNGLIVQDLIVGTGVEAKAGNQVTVDYVGTLEDGTVFDSSFSRNQPFSFTLGVREVIAGWDEGVAGMKVGGNRKLIIPSSLAYGPTGNGTIPPNANLIFEVTLVNVQ